MSSPIGQFVQGRFDELWNHPSTRDLADYIAMPITVFRSGEALATCTVDYVWMGRVAVIDATPIMEHLADYGISVLTVAAENALGVERAVSELRFLLSRLDHRSMPTRDAVDPLFDEKYGRHEADNHIRLLIKLTEP